MPNIKTYSGIRIEHEYWHWTQQPLILSPQLSTLLGETQLSRPETVKRIWAYIKQHELQDQNDKRYIICDENLRTVFPTAKVHMFTMNKILSSHLYPMNKADNIADVKSEDIKSEGFASSPVSAAFSHQDSPSSLESEVSWLLTFRRFICGKTIGVDAWPLEDTKNRNTRA